MGSVAFARYVIQVDTQMEWDAREIPSSWTTGYVPMGAPAPGALPRRLHGSDVFELNESLRDVAMSESMPLDTGNSQITAPVSAAPANQSSLKRKAEDTPVVEESVKKSKSGKCIMISQGSSSLRYL